jgi:Ca2+-transporting ATPase
VGDIALLEPGEVIPCDGIFLSGYNVRCDESDATGESDTIKKIPYSECCALAEHVHEAHAGLEQTENSMLDDPEAHADCFLLSGSRVLEGVGKYVVVAVGTKCFNGRIMMGQAAPQAFSFKGD